MVSAAFTNLGQAKSFGMKATITGDSQAFGISGDVTMEVVQGTPRSVYIKVGDQIELIVLGADAYVKAGTAGWQKSPMAAAQLDQLEQSLDFAGNIKPEDLATMDVSKVGSEKIDGVDTDVFNVTVSDPTASTTKVWIASASKQFVKQVMSDQGSTITMSFYGWNAITIEAPKL